MQLNTHLNRTKTKLFFISLSPDHKEYAQSITINRYFLQSTYVNYVLPPLIIRDCLQRWRLGKTDGGKLLQ